MMNASAAQKASLEIPYGTKGSPERAAYRDKQNAVTKAFRDYLMEAYASELPASVAASIWDKAYADGDGFRGMEFVYEELADFAESVIAAVK